MYPINQKYLLKLGGTVDPLASRSVSVPLLVEDVVQNLSVWVHRSGNGALGAGSLVVARNGQTLITTPFAGNFIVAPINLYQIGTDFEMELLNPPTSSRRTMTSVWRFDGAQMIEDKDLAKFDTAPRNMDMTMTVTNGNAAKGDFVLQWVANVLRDV